MVVPVELRSPANTGPETIQVLDMSAVMAELRAGNKINAIKLYREQTGVGLKEAKDAVEQLEASGWNASQHSQINFQVTTDALRPTVLPPTKRSSGVLVVFTVLVVLLVAIGAVAGFIMTTQDQPTPMPTATIIPSPTPFAQSVLAFGSAGSGAGYFKDARSVAVDTQGQIYVGDYIPGRIQAFSADGTYLWQYLTPGDTDYVVSLAAGLDGKLYAEVGRNIDVFEAQSGKLLSEWKPAEQFIGFYQALAVTPKGEVLAVMERELVKFDTQGHVLLHVGGLNGDFLQQVGVKDSSVNINGMAVDGSGNIYIATTGNFILKLAGDGTLIDRLNGEGDSGESVEAIAIDGQDRIAWGYSSKIVLTDTEGRHLGEFKAPFMRDMEFNIKGQLIAVHNTDPQIRVYSFGGQ